MHSAPVNSNAVGPLFLFRWGLWFAILAGLVQVLGMAVAWLAVGHIVHVSLDVVWIAPVANAVVFGVAAAGLQVIGRGIGWERTVGVAAAVFVFLWLLGPVVLLPKIHHYALLTLAAGASIQAARIIRRRASSIDAWIRRTLPLLIALVSVLGLGLQAGRFVIERRTQSSLPAAAADAPNVILIVLDTVRAKSLGLYGYQRATSPNLDRFARTGVVFDRAFSTSPWTLPSHGSLFTGRLPHDMSADWLTPLDDAHPTLAERLSERGYLTGGFVANLLYGTQATGLARGFLKYSDYPLSVGTFAHHSWLVRALYAELRRVTGIREFLVRKSAAEINDEFFDWISGRPARPFFAFLNYFDAHYPYLPEPPFDTRFASGPLPDAKPRHLWNAEETQRSMAAYEGAIAYLDEHLGKLFENLRAQGLLEKTLIVITSDHGEHFGEHGLFDHANSLYRPLLQVPLVFSFATRLPPELRIDAPVSLVDLPATILDVVDKTGAPALPGRSLAGYWREAAGTTSMSPPIFAEVSKGINLPGWWPVSKGRMQAVVLDGLHYIRNGDGTEELYDLARDPGESENLVGRADLRQRLEAARLAVDAALTRR